MWSKCCFRVEGVAEVIWGSGWDRKQDEGQEKGAKARARDWGQV